MKEHQPSPIPSAQHTHREHEGPHGGMWMMWVCVAVMLLFALQT